MKSLRLTLALILTLSTAVFAAEATPAWQPLPRYGGTATALSSSAGVVYTGTETSGVFRSTAGGTVWRPSEEGLQSLRILKVAAQPRQPAVVFATAQTISEQSVGVLRSTDGGLSWTRVNHGLGDSRPLEVTDLIFNPFDAGTLYAATADGLFRTRNQGQSWQRVGLDGYPIYALAADPFHPGSLLASAFQRGFTLLGSTDGGATWRPRNQGIPSPASFTVLFFDPRTPDKVLAAGNGWPTCVSRDAGATWTNTDHPLASLTTGSGGTLLGAPYADYGLQRSTDGGFTWSPAGALADQVFQLLFVGGRHYAAGALGIWVSADGGATWRPSSQGLSARTYQDLTAAGGALYVDAMEGLLASTDGGLNWRPLRNPALPQPSLSRILAARPGTIYASTEADAAFYNRIFRSTDGGAAWTTIDPGLGGDRFVLAVDPRHPEVLYAGSNLRNGPDQILCHLARSVDAGRTWSCLASEASVRRLMVEPATSTLYLLEGGFVAALVNSRLENRDAGLPSGLTEAIAFDPRKDGTIYAATPRGLFKTTNGGRLWTRSGQGMAQGTIIHSVAVDPRTASVYAGSNGRVYRSRNGGATWELLGAGLPARVPVSELTLDGKDPLRLYAVVQGRGLYALDLEP